MKNSATEARALELVVEYELARLGISDASSIKRMPRGCGYDLESPDGRKIEVKGSSGLAVNTGFRLNSRQEIDFVATGGHVYRVLDVFGTPHLYVINGQDLRLSLCEWASVTAPSHAIGERIELTHAPAAT